MAKKRARDEELEQLKQATMKKKFELELANEEARKEKKVRLDQFDIKAALGREKRIERLNKQRQKTSEVMHEMEEQRKNPMRHSFQQHNFQSYMIELEPRFARIGKLLTNLQMQFFQEYIGQNFSEWRDNVNRNKILQRSPKIKDQSFEVPDLRYFVEIGDNGEITTGFDPDFIKRFVVKCDEYGNPELDAQGKEVIDKEKETIFQQALKEAMEKWLTEVENNVDGHGYFLNEEGSQSRAYPIAFQARQDSRVILNQEMVQDRYELSDCNCFGGAYAPKPNARPKPGKEPIPMLEQADLIRLMDNETEPTKSLNYFLEHEFEGLTFQPTHRLGM